ncbi:hypothetical protein BDN70DRAFT_807455 [Pholiota conissans]|uniref:Sucraseferredoxin-like protein n=1 Tax=Pholiota conissans TaxID=109636 RepID=A0A9P5Z475_9AGAR|nr:hypothetical protein BDN70DRAFT_807455 [Pholiota conissans]
MLSRATLRRYAAFPFIRTRTFTTSRSKQPEDVVPQYFEGRLEPNAPSHQCYILLHSSQSPTEFPSVHKTPLSQELQARATQWGGLVNFAWSEDLEKSSSSEGQAATVFSHSGGRLEIPHVSLKNVEEVTKLIEKHLQCHQTEPTPEEVHFYVCTHGARDCRCGDRGLAVYNALVSSVKSAREKEPSGPASRIKVAEVGHVGGHKFAANVLYFPQGEWLGLVKPEDAPSLVARACEDLKKGAKPLGTTDMPAFPAHWRGRMGLTKEEQKELHATFQTP